MERATNDIYDVVVIELENPVRPVTKPIVVKKFEFDLPCCAIIWPLLIRFVRLRKNIFRADNTIRIYRRIKPLPRLKLDL